jgi:hypothetical protein
VPFFRAAISCVGAVEPSSFANLGYWFFKLFEPNGLQKAQWERFEHSSENKPKFDRPSSLHQIIEAA